MTDSSGVAAVRKALREPSAARPAMSFVLNGFSEAGGYRIFNFDGIASDRSRTAFTVCIDVALSRGYGIRLQELPLLCRAVLEHRPENDVVQSYTYSEDAMGAFAAAASAREAAARARKPPRRPVPEAQDPASGHPDEGTHS
jgi:hypothetical protein